MPLQSTSGAATYDAFGGGVAAVPVYIEDVFSTYLYTGNGSTQTITNGIDLAGKGGLTWIKSRSAATNHQLFDTVRGATKELISNSTAAEATDADTLTAFNADGFALGADSNTNTNAATYVSWTFRKQPKFFDVVTYTGDGTSSRSISHSLGSLPGCIIVKRTDAATNWSVWHRSLAAADAASFITLNTTGAASSNAVAFTTNGNTTTTFSVGSFLNGSGQTFVAYVYAHDAGGFGLTGLDNVISCGSWSGTDAQKEINVGFEPQWLLVKQVTASSSTYGNWHIVDTMRGLNVNLAYNSPPYLEANTTDAEGTGNPNGIALTHTGFKVDTGWSVGSWDYIYIAIRRGPMKVPTSGTSVFSPVVRTGTDSPTAVSVGLAPDLVVTKRRFEGNDYYWIDKLRGALRSLSSTSTLAEISASGSVTAFNNTGFLLGTNSDLNGSGAGTNGIIHWSFARAPGFFDEVCYTGTGSATALAHNLGVVPELIIYKNRSATSAWGVIHPSTAPSNVLYLNTFAAKTATSIFANWGSNISATEFRAFNDVTNFPFSTSSNSYVAYLFATCPGVSKVGSYTGTGTTLQINCGFTGGARFVMIKRTDSTGGWYVWDSARGIVAGNDPYLLFNSTAAEVTNTDYVDTYSLGFEISSTAPAAINANGGTFIFLAIA